MKNILISNNNRRLNFTSRYNVKLYKKSLSLKLILENDDNLYKQPNIVYTNGKSIPSFNLKCIYTRKEFIPLRLLRFFFLVSSTVNLTKLGINFLIAQKLSVYNGRQTKFINTNTAY